MNRKGFTLIEVVISVAFLAILGVFMVKLFIHADNLNIKAKELDHSVIITQNILELIEKEGIAGAELEGDYELSWNEKAEGRVAMIYFDDKFSRVDSIENSTYELIIDAKELERSGDGKGIYGFELLIIRNHLLPLETNGKEIYRVSARKVLRSWE